MSNWQPLESNPEVINKYLTNVGLDTSEYSFQELLSFEPWAQEMVQPPVLGLLYIYEITDKQEEHRQQEEERIKKDGQHVDPQIFYMKQYADNACGTVGVFHILGNVGAEYSHVIQQGSLLDKFFTSAKGKTPEEAGNIFQNHDELKEKHVEATLEGHTNVEEHQDTRNHFIAFVQRGGHLYELDGRKSRPINHGPTTPETFLADACTAAQRFMEREPENLNAGMIVLARNPPVEE